MTSSDVTSRQWAMARWVVCLLSIPVLLGLGELGGQLQNQFRYDYGSLLPAPASFVAEYYPLNSGAFTVSLTPFMIALLGLAALGGGDGGQWALFWHVFVAVWLIAVGYFVLFAVVVVAPFTIMMTLITTDALWTAVQVIDGILVAFLAAVWLRRARRRRRQD